MLVAASSASAPSDDDGIADAGEVVDLLAGDVVKEDGAYGNLEDGVFAGVSGAVGAEAVASALRLVLGVEPEVNQGVVAERRLHDDVAAASAVAA